MLRITSKHDSPSNNGIHKEGSYGSSFGSSDPRSWSLLAVCAACAVVAEVSELFMDFETTGLHADTHTCTMFRLPSHLLFTNPDILSGLSSTFSRHCLTASASDRSILWISLFSSNTITVTATLVRTFELLTAWLVPMAKHRMADKLDHEGFCMPPLLSLRRGYKQRFGSFSRMIEPACEE
jgi:hypothetical protein